MRDRNFLTRLTDLTLRRWVGMVMGNVVLAVGISILKWSHTGNDPFSGMIMALADVCGVTYAVFLICFNCFLFLLEIVWGRKYIGAGTLVNWFLLGPVVDFVYPFWIHTFHEADSLPKQLLLAVIGVVVISLGCSLYQTSDAGIAPYDSLAIIGEDRTPLPYFWARMICDATCALVCFLAHGVMGIGMFLCAFCLGPVISFFNKFVSVPLLVRERDPELAERALYVSDLDGTLLRGNERISEYTIEVINRMTEQGMLFSYATARSIYTAKYATAGLDAKIPLILYNGAFIMDNQTHEILYDNFFGEDVRDLLDDLFAHDIYPIVYKLIDGNEKFSYIPAKSSRGTMRFVESRKDARNLPVESVTELKGGRCFYITCIDQPEKLLPFYEKYKERYSCVYHKDIYSGEQWLEFMPPETTKATAVMKLKQLLGCSRVVAFGDGLNDREMFQLADWSLAMANAAPELKEIASDVIGSNDEDGVARWLEEHAMAGHKTEEHET